MKLFLLSQDGKAGGEGCHSGVVELLEEFAEDGWWEVLLLIHLKSLRSGKMGQGKGCCWKMGGGNGGEERKVGKVPFL